ncbi:MAG TPA: right-handed parallel beta-helix repeat-containing protein [Verrucomicrobiae bacterium]|nr:right-handed parallel beta-helix repeat-containing protein [Verrucomicrobiae bacterium]
MNRYGLIKHVCSLLVGAGAVWNVSAATYYVDNAAGSDTAAGTSTNSPWQHCPGDTAATGTAAGTKFAPGDTVVFHGGVRYDVASNATIYATSSGSAGSPITYLSGHLASPQWGSSPAVINGTNMSSSARGAVDLSGYSYLTANGLVFVGCSSAASPYSSGIGGHWNSGGNVSILNCSVSNSTACGIYIMGNYSSSAPSTFVISNCLVQTIGAHGILCRYGMTNMQIINNVITNCGLNTNANLTGDCIGVFGLDGTGLNANLVIRSNELADAHIKSPMIFEIYDVGAVVEQNYIHGGFGFSGFDLNGVHTNLTIRNNVWDMQALNYWGPITFDTDAGTVYADGIYIYNNTVRTTIQSGNQGMVVYFGRGNNTATTAFWHVALTNNILIQSTAGSPVIVVAANTAGTGPIVDAATFGCDNNVYAWTNIANPFLWRGTNYTFAEWQAVASADAHSLTNMPAFVSSTDLHLSDGDTVARGNGANFYSLFTTDKDGNTRPSIGPWDIGAYVDVVALGARPASPTGLHFVSASP